MDWSVREQNGKATLTVTRPDDCRGLYRAYAVGPTGQRCLLGTLTPAGGRLTLRRALAVDALKQRGCYPVATVTVELAHPFAPALPLLPGWSAPPACLPFPDDILRTAYQRSAPKPYHQSVDAGFSLAYPYADNAPFPLPPLFCFARLASICGQPLWLFSFDARGTPILDA